MADHQADDESLANGTGSQHSTPTTGRRRKPVPTPRSTLRKPTAQALVKTNGLNDSQAQESPSLIKENSCCSTASDRKSKCLESEDILAALEKIPGVGSLRSFQSSSLGNSLPSLQLSASKREESSHSLTSQSPSSGQFSEKSSDVQIQGKQGVQNRFFNTERPRLKRQPLSKDSGTASGTTMSINSPVSKSSSTTAQTTNTSCEDDGNDHENSSCSVKRSASCDEDSNSDGNRRSSIIQSRPLPQVPSPQRDDVNAIVVLKEEHTSLEEEHEEDEVYSALITPSHYNKNCQGTKIMENQNGTSSIKGLTMTGTMRRGRLKKEECLYDVQVDFGPDHLSKIEKRVHDKYHDRCFCGIRRGIHVFILTLISLPFIWIYSTALAFYQGTLTWYNIFLHYNEDRSFCYKIISPWVLLIYPLWIVPVTVFLGAFGALYQLSWYFDSWIEAVTAPDGGFFDWFCNFIDVPDCSPYQVIVLSPSNTNTQNSCVSKKPVAVMV